MSDNWPFDLPDYTPERGQLLLVGVMYEGPWERLSTWLLAIDWRTTEIKHEIKTHGMRDRLAAWCELRDHAWRRRYVERGVHPGERWRRRSVGPVTSVGPPKETQ